MYMRAQVRVLRSRLASTGNRLGTSPSTGMRSSLVQPLVTTPTVCGFELVLMTENSLTYNGGGGTVCSKHVFCETPVPLLLRANQFSLIKAVGCVYTLFAISFLSFYSLASHCFCGLLVEMKCVSPITLLYLFFLQPVVLSQSTCDANLVGPFVIPVRNVTLPSQGISRGIALSIGSPAQSIAAFAHEYVASTRCPLLS